MKSMTGYGNYELSQKDFTTNVEIKSYNNKFLDINLNLPHYLAELEIDIRNKVAEFVQRGRVDVYIKYRDLNQETILNIDEKALKTYSQTLNKIKKTAKIKTRLSLEYLLSFDDILKIERKNDIDLIRKRIFPALDKALADYEETRIIEGKSIKKDILEKLDTIKTNVGKITSHATGLEIKIKENIETRFKEFNLETQDNNRIYEEIAMLLMKYSINEELSRLEAHLKSFYKDLEKGLPNAKKLDFLCQELNREINTIGSKSMIVEINQAVVEVKESIDMIREQLRNAE